MLTVYVTPSEAALLDALRAALADKALDAEEHSRRTLVRQEVDRQQVKLVDDADQTETHSH